jgi:hypothetical protein
MNSDDVAKAYNDGLVQFSYFLTAAAGAAIGYTINKLDGQVPTLMMLPGIAALVCWLVSFISGGLYVTAGIAALGSQHILMQLHEGVHPKQPPNRELVAAAADITEKAIRRKVGNARRAYLAQQATLYLGLAAFVVWRAWDLLSRAHVIGK